MSKAGGQGGDALSVERPASAAVTSVCKNASAGRPAVEPTAPENPAAQRIRRLISIEADAEVSESVISGARDPRNATGSHGTA
jgi:hypothetical protein